MSVTVLVNTCDRYEVAWAPFCHGMAKYWPDNPWPVVATTNHLDFPCGYGLRLGDDKGWAAGLRRALEVVDDVVLLMHEDYWLQGRVDTGSLVDFARLVETGRADKVFLVGGPLESAGTYNDDPRLEVTSPRSDYRTATHGLWRTSVLRALLRDGETPWQFELAGNARSFDPALTFLQVADDRYMTYIRPPGAIKRGQWKQEARDYAAREGLAVDFSVAPGAYQYA